MTSTSMVVIGLIILLSIAYASIYNGIIRAENRCDNASETIDTQLQRRLDLIPNLVETVKGYAAHESSTLEAVTNARAAVADAKDVNAKVEADTKLTQSLRQLFAVAEAYPDLKANANFIELQSQLQDAENRIAYARQSFNDCVMAYNNAIKTFPGNIVAGLAHLSPKTGFSAQDGADQAPKVKF